VVCVLTRAAAGLSADESPLRAIATPPPLAATISAATPIASGVLARGWA